MEYSLGLIGKSLVHSFSARYFAEKFLRENIRGCYSLYELKEISDFADLLHRTPALSGLNVTIPYKEVIIPYLSELSPEAQAIGAVNCISIRHEPSGEIFLKGYNTDANGFARSLIPVIEECRDKFLTQDYGKALVLGTGGAAKAVGYALKEMGISPLFLSRNPKRNFPLGKVIAYTDLTEEIVSDAGIIVNATPVGTFPDVKAAPPFPFDLLCKGQIAHDLVYNPAETLFMKKAAARGCIVKNGYDMLRYQAEASWDIWK